MDPYTAAYSHLIPLLIRQIPQVDALNLCTDDRSQVLDTRASREESFFLRVRSKSSVFDLKSDMGIIIDFGVGWLSL